MTAKTTKFLTFSRQKLSHFLCCALCIFFIILVSACGDAQHSSSETGSIAFSIEWKDAPTIHPTSRAIKAASLDCEAAGVTTVRFDLYDENNSYLVGDSWPCSYHQGTVYGVPVGADRKLVVTGEDSSGNVLYRAEKSGIIVTAGQTTDVGTIVAEPFNLALLIPSGGSTVTNGAFAFQWSDVTGTSEYQIQVSEDTSFASTVIDETVTTTHYVPTTTLSADTHYWRVRAEDSYGNQSAWSEAWSFIVSGESGSAPSTPTNVSTTAGNEQITISWDSVTGATSYNIYWSTSQGVTKETGTKISTFSSPYTHTGLINGTSYYYVVTAENDYGESDESDELNATPSVTTYPDTVVDTISVGSAPWGAAVTPNGSYVYVTNGNDDTVSVIQTSDNTVVDTISVGNNPLGVTLTPNGSYVYVTNSWDDTVSVIQTSDNTVVDTISVGDYPRGIEVTSDGNYVYLANYNADTVSVIQTSDNTVIDTISVGSAPWGIAMTPNGSYVYVSNSHAGTVSVIQTSDNTVVDTISVSNGPRGIAMTPNGSRIYVTKTYNDTVSVIQTSDNTVVDTISVGAYPRGIAMTPNGSYVYVTNGNDDTVSVIQTSGNTVVDTISVGDDPYWVTISPNGNYVYVANSGDNTVSIIGLSE